MSEFRSFREFYPYYLSEHSDRTCRRLHFLGSSLVLAWGIGTAVSGQWAWLPLALVWGYGCAWVGHYGFEKNRPATFKYPLYSFIGDWVMVWHMLTGKIAF